MGILDNGNAEKLLKEPFILAAICLPLLYIVFMQMVESGQKLRRRHINPKIKKDELKVVDKVDCGEIENLAQFKDGKLVMCRCWRSSTFPYCDGKFDNLD